MPAQDTAELFFDDVRVPAANLLGEEGQGFVYLMQNLPQERLSIAVAAVAAAETVARKTIEYVKDRTAFGRPIGTFQNSRFVLAEMATEIESPATTSTAASGAQRGRADRRGRAKAKWWTTELQNKVVDRCLQLHGGYGYMNEYPVAKA